MEQTMRKIKFFKSFMKEKIWLEEMALQGYFLTNLHMGVVYTFQAGEPQRLVYDTDRFDLPQDPSLKDIQQKENFVSLAEEMGWKEVTHDEDLNYYFCKPYEEDGVNEIYDTDEGRRLHAEKYREHYHKGTGELICSLFLFSLFMTLASAICQKQLLWELGLVASMLMAFLCFLGEQMGRQVYREMRMGAQEWLRTHGRLETESKRVYRLFFTTKGFTEFLQRQSLQGWHLIGYDWISCRFEKGSSAKDYYVVDSRLAVNRRRTMQHQSKISDSKDITLQNNDWQVCSVQEAQQVGLSFVCAYGNNQILYRSSQKTELAGNSRFSFTWLTYSLIFFGSCFLVGFAAGFLYGWLV